MDVVELGVTSMSDLDCDLHHPVRTALSKDCRKDIFFGGSVAFESLSLHSLVGDLREESTENSRGEAEPFADLNSNGQEKRRFTEACAGVSSAAVHRPPPSAKMRAVEVEIYSTSDD